MVSGSDNTGEGKPVDPADAARLAEALNPLMNNPAAAMAAATAIGFGLATQMTSLFLGSLQGALDATGKLARKLEDERKAAEVADKAPSSEAARAEQVKPAVAAAPRETSRAVKAAKPAVAKQARPAPAKPAVVGPMASDGDKPARVLAAKPKAKASRSKGDDLKKIEGIGPKLEQVLNGRGISRFAEIAELDEKALEALDMEIGLGGRVLRDDWAGQARRLMGGKVRSGK